MSLEPWIPCRNLQRSIKFYVDVLDFELVESQLQIDESVEIRHAVLTRDGYLLHLDSHAREKGMFGTQFYIRVHNVDELYEQFLSNGLDSNLLTIKKRPYDQSWGMREFSLKDPDGNGITYGQELVKK